MELVGTEEALMQTNRLIEYAREEEYKIYFVQHFASREGVTFFLPNTKGVELNEKLDIQEEMIIKKSYPNSFRDTELQEELEKEGISKLIICGAMTHMCIDTTVRAGFDLGYTITVASDACATRDLNLKTKQLKQKMYIVVL